MPAALYDAIGLTYSTQRRPDPRIEAAIDELRAIQAEEDAPTGPVGTEVPSVD